MHSFLSQHNTIYCNCTTYEGNHRLTVTYGVILFYLNFFFFAATVLLNIVLLQLKQGSSPLVQLTIAESSDVSREYFTLITEKLPLYENQEDQS